MVAQCLGRGGNEGIIAMGVCFLGDGNILKWIGVFCFHFISEADIKIHKGDLSSVGSLPRWPGLEPRTKSNSPRVGAGSQVLTQLPAASWIMH